MAESVSLPADLRLILVHKQKTSARVRFLRFPHGFVGLDPLPALSVVEEEAEGEPSVPYHPNTGLRAVEERLGLESGSLRAEAEYHATVQTPAGPVTVLLASLDYVDPPFEAAEAIGGRFLAITEARGCTPVELELLRRAYIVMLG